MLSSVLELKDPLFYIMRNTSNTEFKSIFFSNSDWVEIGQLKRIFEVFVKPSIKLQGQVYITISEGLLYIYQIYNKLEGLNSDFLNSQNSEVSYLFFFF